MSTPSVSAAQPAPVPLNGSAVPAVLGSSSGLALAAVRDGVVLASDTVWDATEGEAAVTTMLIDTDELPGGVQLTDLLLSYESAEIPEGGAVSLEAVSTDGVQVPWPAGDSHAVDAQKIDSLAWTFARPGEYKVVLTVAATVVVESASTSPSATEAGATGEETTDSSAAASEPDPEQIELTAELRIDVRQSDEPQVSRGTTEESAAPGGTTEGAPTLARAQIEAVARADGDGPVVLGAGHVSLTPLLDAAQVDVSAKEFTGFQLGLLDKTGEYAAQQWYSPEDAIIHVSDTDLDSETGRWSLPAQVEDLVSYTSGDAARLLVGVDSAMAVGGVNNAFTAAVANSPQAQYALVDVTGPENGRLRVLSAGAELDAPTWDSSLLKGGSQPGTLATAKGSKTKLYGWTFDAPGRYCVTVSETLTSQASKTPVTAEATYTFYVGELPTQPTLCAQPGDPDNPGDDDPGDPAEPVTVLAEGHTDIRAVLGSDGKLEIGAYKNGFTPSSDVVLAGTYAGTIPEPTEDSDLTFIAPPGSPYWYYTEGAATADGKLWPGFSTENFTRSQLAPYAGISFTLVGVEGLRGAEGGKAALFTVSSGVTMLLDSRTLPMSYTVNPLTHAHMNWGFDKAGQYCLHFETRTQLADGSWATGDGQLTVWTGDPAEADSVVPCDRLDAEPPRSPVAPVTLESSERHLVETDAVTLTPHLNGTELDAAAGVIRGGTVPEYWDVNDLVLSTDMRVRDGWTFTTTSGSGHPIVGYNSDRVPWSSIEGLLDWSVGEIDGPGDLTLTVGNQAAGGYVFDTASSTNSYQLWPNIRRITPVWTFTSSGVYCVPMTWTATLPGTHSSVSVTKLLTVVAGSVDLADADYIDRSTVTTCSRGQTGTPPHDEDPTDPGDDDDLPDSDATVLDIGHVDIASQLAGGSLTTRVKDSSSGEDVIYRHLDDVVFHASELSRTEVPGGAIGALLGQQGDPVWMLPQTQDDALLWPGWSTEEIPLDATRAGVQWSLTNATGPGEFVLFQNDSFGNPTVLFNTRDGVTEADSFEIPQNTHAHGSWAFTAEGTYCLAFQRSATLTSGSAVSDEFVLAVAVGAVNPQKVDPSTCFTEPEGKPDTDDSSPIALDQLTDANAGGVQVLGGENGFTAGELVTTQVAPERAGRWVSVWLDDTAWLGWVQVGSSGAVQVRLPADAAARAHVLVVEDREGALIGWDSLSVVAADTDPGGGDGGDPGNGGEEPTDPDAVWDVVNRTVNEAGATVLNNGHVDIASLVDGGALPTRVKDTTEPGDPVFRDTAKTVLQLLPNARTVVPSGSQWSFLGDAGSSFYQVSQTQQAGLLWPGWSTESIPLSATQGGVNWKLTDITGPGEFALYETGSFGQPSVLFSTRDGITSADAFTIPQNTHAHGSWAFGAQGNYCLAFERSATLASGAGASDRFVLAVAVGRADVMGVDPTECFQTPGDKPTVTDRDPIADDELTSDTRGGVTAFETATGLVPGQLVSIQVSADHAGEWVSVWLHSDPSWLGWAKVDADGAVQVRLPSNAPLGAHKLVIKAQNGTLLGWDSITISEATAPAGPGEAPVSDGTPAAVQVPSTQCVAGATILSSGHIDYASRLVGGQLQSLIGDDTAGAKVYREPSGTILWLKPSSRVTLPAGYGQVGPAGSSVWQVPQTQNPGLIWLGWSTESLNAGNTQGPVTWTINSINGPGSLRVYLSGSFGGVQSMVFNNGGSYSIPLGVHAHANWAFSAEGIYRISTTQTATLANGQVSSDTEILTIVVGNVDPASAAGSGSGCGTISNALLTDDDGTKLSADQAAAAAAEAARDVLPGQGTPVTGARITDPFTALEAGNPVPLLLSILGALLLVGAAGTGVLWWRRRRGGSPA